MANLYRFQLAPSQKLCPAPCRKRWLSGGKPHCSWCGKTALVVLLERIACDNSIASGGHIAGDSIASGGETDYITVSGGRPHWWRSKNKLQVLAEL